jgi:hypothetical protein
VKYYYKVEDEETPSPIQIIGIHNNHDLVVSSCDPKP